MSEAGTFQRIQSLFEEALKQPPEDREAYVRGAGEDPALTNEVLALLHADATAQNQLDSPPEFPVEAIRPETPAEIAGYRIVDELGHGGMGVVFEALQPDTDRPVALKIIRSGLFSQDAARRFELEARVLARLDHPGIATIYESGSATTDAGTQHYFAMELVRGEPLTEHVRSHSLGVRDRLSLLAEIADAVQHAHDRGIIHRDLKPANILVTDDGRPKVLDFGIARALDPDLQSTMMTHTGQLVGTVAYMAPEQLAARPDQIDHRTDIYALGVILYEVLADRLPHDLTGRALLEAVRHVEEHTPSSLATLNRSYRGDIDTIAARAMEKDPDRRYSTAAELAADIRRHLTDQPILARPASTFYQFRKFAKRNKALVSSVGVVFVVLVVALIVVSSSLADEKAQRVLAFNESQRAQRESENAVKQAELAEEQRLIAQRQRDNLQNVNDYLTSDLLSLADPNELGDRGITLMDAIKQSSEGLSERFADAPETEGLIRQTIGWVYLNLFMLEEADPHLRRSLELARANDPHDGTVAVRLNTLAMLLIDKQDFEEATEVLIEAAAIAEAESPEDHSTITSIFQNQASVAYRQRDIGLAKEMFQKAVDHGREFMPDSDSTASAMSSLALIINWTEGPQAAIPLGAEAVELYKRTMGDEHPYTMTAISNHALFLGRAGLFTRSLKTNKELLETRMRIFGPGHSDTLVSKGAVANIMTYQGRYEDALPFATEAFDGMLELFGIDHTYTHATVRTISRIHHMTGRDELADQWLDKLPEGVPREGGPNPERAPEDIADAEAESARSESTPNPDE